MSRSPLSSLIEEDNKCYFRLPSFSEAYFLKAKAKIDEAVTFVGRVCTLYSYCHMM